jgi:competence protein ComEC
MSQKNAKFTDFSIRPLAWIGIFFAFGIFFAEISQFKWHIFFALSIFTLLLTFLLSKFGNKSQFSTLFLLLTFAFSGSLLYEIEKHSISPNRLKTLFETKNIISNEPIEVEGILNGKPELAVGGFFLELSAEKIVSKGIEKNVSGKIRLFAPVSNKQTAEEYDNLQLRYGTQIQVFCLLQRDDKFLNPGVSSIKEILDQKEIDATGIIKSPLLVERIGDREIFQPLAWLYERRQDLILDFKRIFSSQTSGVLIASLLNNRYHLDKSTSDSFRENGTFHALVISGMHITVIGMFVFFFVSRVTKNRWLQFLIGTISIWSYSLMVGAEIPVSRAAIAFTIMLFSRVIFRESNLLNALGASILLILIWRPSDLFDQSFQLTFSCLVAIIGMAFPLIENFRSIGNWHPTAEKPFPTQTSKKVRAFCEAIYWSEKSWKIELSKSIWTCTIDKNPLSIWLEKYYLQRVLRAIFESVLVSFCVQLWLLPFMVFYFHRLSLISLFFNIWIGVLLGFESLTALIAVFLTKISVILATPFVFLTEISNWLMIHAGDVFIENGLSSIRIPIYSGSLKAIYVVYFIPLIALSYLINRWKPFQNLFSKSWRLPSLLLTIFSLIIIFHPFSSPKIDGKLRVDFLDVGQGDSALITFPNGETLLIDGGGKINFADTYTQRDGEEPESFSPDIRTIGESVVSEFLWEKGYDQVDYVLATHADADHIQGLSDIAKNFRVKTAFVVRTPDNNSEFNHFRQNFSQRLVPIRTLSQGDNLRFGGVIIDVLSPENTDMQNAASDNNNSAVLRISFGDHKFLFTADIEKKVETILLNQPQFLEANVVKVSHHGSRTSSNAEFVNATKAEFAIISVGRESQFGHPHEEVVERWKAANAKVLTTGERGTISFLSDGKTLSATTFIP